jgi:hypothetical protein
MDTHYSERLSGRPHHERRVLAYDSAKGGSKLGRNWALHEAALSWNLDDDSPLGAKRYNLSFIANQQEGLWLASCAFMSMAIRAF